MVRICAHPVFAKTGRLGGGFARSTSLAPSPQRDCTLCTRRSPDAQPIKKAPGSRRTRGSVRIAALEECQRRAVGQCDRKSSCRSPDSPGQPARSLREPNGSRSRVRRPNQRVSTKPESASLLRACPSRFFDLYLALLVGLSHWLV